MTDQQWPESMNPETPVVVTTMTERERAEAEEAARLAEMTDTEVAGVIRSHLTRVFIGRETETRDITKSDGTPGSITVRKPHRFVAFFDELVRGYRRE